MAPSGRRILLATIGSLGDLHPIIALAIGLRERGHQAVIASTDIYRAKIEALGLEFHSLHPNTGARDPEVMRAVMDMRRGPEFLLRKLILPALPETYEDLLAAASGADLLIAGEIVYAAPLVAEKLGLPWVSEILSPFSFYSAYDPPVSPYAPSLNFLNPQTRPLNHLLLQFGRVVTNHWWEPVHKLRRELGLQPGRNPLFEDKFAADMVLALFSREIAEPQPDWPKNTIQPGYALYDQEDSSNTLPPSLAKFLDAGEPPIVFTLGSSAVHDPRSFFHESALAAKLLKRRAVFLIGENPQPAEMPADSIAIPYAPFSQLLPRAAAVVHQGGSGTTAQALQAGCPALIMPCGFDQPDNANRVRRRGAGLVISRDRYRAKSAAGKLNRLLTESGFSENVRQIAERLRLENGVAGACDAIEQLLHS